MKKSELRIIVREIVREEVALTIQEVISEIKEPTNNIEVPLNKKNVINKNNYTKNSVLSDILNETANDGDEWETMGGTEYTSDRMGELVGNSYKNLMNDDSGNVNGSLAAEMGVNPNDPTAAFLKKDYRELMSAVDKKRGKN